MEYERLGDLVSLLTSHVKSISNSSLTTSLAGAFAGAYAAMYFADRKDRHRIAIQRLNATNASVILAAAIANHAISFKKQLSKDICDLYKADRQRFKNYLAVEAAEGAKFEIQYDFRSINFFEHEAGELKNLVVQKAAAPENAVMAAFQLSQTLHSLEDVIECRASEIARLTSLKNQMESVEFAKVYFGIHTSEGYIDERFHDLVVALEDQTDSAIFFSTYIAKKLGEQSTKLAKEIGKRAPKAFVWSFDNLTPENAELIPKYDDFPDWK